MRVRGAGLRVPAYGCGVGAGRRLSPAPVQGGHGLGDRAADAATARDAFETAWTRWHGTHARRKPRFGADAAPLADKLDALDRAGEDLARANAKLADAIRSARPWPPTPAATRPSPAAPTWPTVLLPGPYRRGRLRVAGPSHGAGRRRALVAPATAVANQATCRAVGAAWRAAPPAPPTRKES